MSQQSQDTLTAAYRRASEADAGRPAAATRQAILAQAAAMAARRAPAANDARYWPRMVAGIVVLGVGVLLWKQMDLRMPGDAPEVVMAPTTEAKAELAPESVPEPVAARARGDIAESTGATAQVVPPSTVAASSAPPASAPPSREESSRAVPSPPPPQAATPDPFPDSPRMADAAAPLPPAPPPTVTAPPAPPILADNRAAGGEARELSEVAVTGTREFTPGGARAGAPRGGQAPGAGAAPRAGGGGARAGAPGGGAPPRGQASAQDVDRVALLRQYFPAQFESDAPYSLWLVQDATGKVELSGELERDQRLEDLEPQIARALGGRMPGPWQTATVRNARGQSITLAIARLQ